MKLFIIIFSILFCVGCGSGAATSHKEIMPLPDMPLRCIQEGKADSFLADHFWNTVDECLFEDKEQLRTVARNYIKFLQQTSDEILVQQAIGSSLSLQAKDSTRWVALFDCYETLLDTKDTEDYSEFYLVEVLSCGLNSEHISPFEKQARLKSRYNLIFRNNPRSPAEDFSFQTSDGKQMRRSDITTEWTVLLFYSPECPACAEFIRELEHSENFNHPNLSGKITFLAIYTEDNPKAWTDYQHAIPERWTNGIDKGETIRVQNLYDLRSIPSFYIIDSNNDVVVKDIGAYTKIAQARCGAPCGQR